MSCIGKRASGWRMDFQGERGIMLSRRRSVRESELALRQAITNYYKESSGQWMTITPGVSRLLH